MRRRAFVVLCVCIAFASGIVVEHARSQSKPRMWATVLLNFNTDKIPKRTRVHANLDYWEPGAETGWHNHPGPTVFVMLDGEVEETVKGGQTRKLVPGQAFWQPARREHNVKNVGNGRARAVAVHLDPAS